MMRSDTSVNFRILFATVVIAFAAAAYPCHSVMQNPAGYDKVVRLLCAMRLADAACAAAEWEAFAAAMGDGPGARSAASLAAHSSRAAKATALGREAVNAIRAAVSANGKGDATVRCEGAMNLGSRAIQYLEAEARIMARILPEGRGGMTPSSSMTALSRVIRSQMASAGLSDAPALPPAAGNRATFMEPVKISNGTVADSGEPAVNQSPAAESAVSQPMSAEHAISQPMSAEAAELTVAAVSESSTSGITVEDAADIQAVDTQAVDTQVADTRVADTQVADTRVADTQVAGEIRQNSSETSKCGSMDARASRMVSSWKEKYHKCLFRNLLSDAEWIRNNGGGLKLGPMADSILEQTRRVRETWERAVKRENFGLIREALADYEKVLACDPLHPVFFAKVRALKIKLDIQMISKRQ